MRHEYAVHAGVYEDTWHDYETHKRRKIWRGKRKEGVALSPTLSHGERERRGCRRQGSEFPSPQPSPTGRGSEGGAPVRADWVRNNFFALRKY